MKQTLNLESLRQGIKECITANLGGYMSDCAVACLHRQNHENQAELHLKTDIEEQILDIFWTTEVDKQLLVSTNDNDVSTDYGAMAIALLLTQLLTKYAYFERSQKGSGIDFWLSENANDVDFSARLEISGINREKGRNTVATRLNQKIKQVRLSADSQLPVYICITEFHKPQSNFSRYDSNQ
jgi:hypothetical protein